jgi:signal transduction histidine kinase
MLVGADGGRLPYQITVRPTGLLKSGEPVGVVTLRDLGERQIRLLQERFLALVAHELRAPLSGIRGYAELLTSYFQDGLGAAEVQVVAERVQCLAERLDLMLEDLLDVARISSGKLRIQRTRFDLRAIVVSATELAQARPDAPIIGMELPGEPITLDVDPSRLSDVILNLLTNAIKHAAGATRVDVRLKLTSNGPVIEVEDDGRGIPPSELPFIFDRHHQVLRGDDAGVDASDGLGLGLFIARQTVLAHGGQLDVESMPGVRTRFTIRLPIG